MNFNNFFLFQGQKQIKNFSFESVKILIYINFIAVYVT